MYNSNKKLLRFIVLSSMIVGALFTFSGMTFSQDPDTTAPELVDFDITPQSVDVTYGTRGVDFVVEVTDVGTGVSSVAVYVSPAFGGQQSYACILSAGTELDGTWRCKIYIKQVPKNIGTWYFLSLQMIDAAGNQNVVNRFDLGPLGYPITFEVLGDPEAPQLTSFDISPRSVDIIGGTRSVSFFAEATDVGTGVESVAINVVDRTGRQRGCATTLIAGDNFSGTWKCTIYPKVGWALGTYTVLAVVLTDAAGNGRAVDRFELGPLGYPVTFEVTGDPEAPQLANFDITPQTVDVSGGTRAVDIIAQVTDVGTGTSTVAVYISPPSGGQGSYACTLLSGSEFDGSWRCRIYINNSPSKIGTWYFLTLLAIDQAGNRNEIDRFEVGAAGYPVTFKVISDAPPAIEAHANLTAEAMSDSGAIVNFTPPNAIDAVDGTFPASCAPSSGSTFALGNTLVTCNATDSVGNTATPTSFSVTVEDTTAPALSRVPTSQTIEAISVAGTPVTYSLPTALDFVDGARVASCAPSSGSTFSLGDTLVTCSASDTRGNIGEASFTIAVQDSIAPSLFNMPDNQTVIEGISGGGIAVSYLLPNASDIVDPSPAVRCAPASGSVFQLGDTTVTCTATDNSGNISQASFAIKVLTPAEGVIALLDEVEANGDAASAASTLKKIAALLTDGNTNNDGAVCNKLGAFINNIEHKRDQGKLTDDEANGLIVQAQAIMTSLECSAN
jgi:hypothetical protein